MLTSCSLLSGSGSVSERHTTPTSHIAENLKTTENLGLTLSVATPPVSVYGHDYPIFLILYAIFVYFVKKKLVNLPIFYHAFFQKMFQKLLFASLYAGNNLPNKLVSSNYARLF